MSHAILAREKHPRINFSVEIDLESEANALKTAKYLEDLSEKIDDEECCCYAWAKELAEIIRNK